MEKSLKDLSISQDKLQKPPITEPMDSWEDEADSLELQDDKSIQRPITPPQQFQPPAPPPPTPISPNLVGNLYGGFGPPPQDFGSSTQSERDPNERRQDKTTLVAARLIAAGIGQKVPRRTQEERQYDQAMRNQERQRREKAKAEEERKKREKEQAMKDIWGN